MRGSQRVSSCSRETGMLHFTAKLSVPSESGVEGGGLLLMPCNRWEFTLSHCSVTLFFKKVVNMLLLGFKLEAVFHKPYEVLVVSFCCLSALQCITHTNLKAFGIHCSHLGTGSGAGCSPNGCFLKQCLPKSAESLTGVRLVVFTPGRSQLKPPVWKMVWHLPHHQIYILF